MPTSESMSDNEDHDDTMSFLKDDSIPAISLNEESDRLEFNVVKEDLSQLESTPTT